MRFRAPLSIKTWSADIACRSSDCLPVRCYDCGICFPESMRFGPWDEGLSRGLEFGGSVGLGHKGFGV